MTPFQWPVIRMCIHINTINLGQFKFAGPVPAFSGSLDQGIGIVMAPSDYKGYFFIFCNQFNQVLHFIINRIHGMPVRFNTFLITFSRGINQVLDITKIKMAQQQNFIAIKKIIALNVEERLQKRYPECIRTPDTQVALGP